MPWTDDEWEAFCAIVEEAWPGEFDDSTAKAWRVLFRKVEPAVAVGGVERLMLEGRKWRPSASEVLGEGRRDPSKPTFDEVLALLYGRGGVFQAREPSGPYAGVYEIAQARQAAREERLRGLHPLVVAFVYRQGMERLATLPLNDEEYGELRRKELRGSWEEHCEAFDGREIAVLAAGGDRREGLRQLDPLAGLPGRLRPVPALESGELA